MGLISKFASSSIGIASEAIHHSRRKKDAASESDASLASPDGTQSVGKANILDRARAAKDKEIKGSSLRTQTTQSSEPGLTASQKSKAREARYGDNDDGYDSDERNQDEAAWELDEAAHESRLPTYEEANQPQYMTLSADDAPAVKESKKDAMITALRKMAGPVEPETVKELPVPVIIPQRRPRFKERGFVRAYAPLLADSGIGQDMFIEFLEVFDKACESDVWIDVIYMASGIASFAPSLAIGLGAQLIQTVAATAIEVQTRRRRNNFLDRVNEEIFKPRGLFAMVMAFKDHIPENKNGVRRVTTKFGQIMMMMPEKMEIDNEHLDHEEAAKKYSQLNAEMSRTTKEMRKLRLASGETNNTMELPEAAPLIYPDLDKAAARALEGHAQGMKKAGVWVGDYMDRRFQTMFELKNPGHVLAVPSSEREGFVSRYNDPNSKANSGSLTAVLTGGKYGHHSLADRFVMIQDAIKKRRNGGELPDLERVRGARRARLKEKKTAWLRKTMVQDVLYLMIVNLPGEDAVEKSVADLEQMLEQAGTQLPPGVMGPLSSGGPSESASAAAPTAAVLPSAPPA